MKFPNLVFKIGNSHHAWDGKKYDYIPVNNQDELEKALKNGYCETLEEAINGLKIKDDVSVGDDDKNAPTRLELEAKAKELEITFHHKLSDAKLLALINKKLGV